ncbi:MAG: ATP-binding protein [Myxococcota bacterium]
MYRCCTMRGGEASDEDGPSTFMGAPMSLRWRLSAALLLVVVVAVAGGTAAHLAEVSRRFEQQLQQQSSRVVAAIEVDLAQAGDLLDEELRASLDPRGYLARSVAAGRADARYLIANGRLERGRLEVLKLLDADGQILTSGHWPASFGALDPQVETYRTDPGVGARIIDEATPAGSAPSLQRWARVRWGGRDLIVVAGRFLDAAALELMRARVGADLIALCRPDQSESRCIAVRSPALASERVFEDDRSWTENLVLSQLALGAGTEPPELVAGLDRRGIDAVEQGIVERAVAVGALSILLSLLLGVLLATRQVRPVEALADAAGRLAGGDLAARVDDEGGGVEMRRLVTAFNQMATEIERSQTRLKQAERVAAWREIARGLAHELKNPLTPILGAMDVIRKARRLGRSDFDAILDEQADAVVEEVMRLKELADAFSRFARLPDPRLEPLDLGQVVDNAVALYVGEGSNVIVSRHYQQALPSLVADRTQLATAVTNLVKNAVEAMDGTGRLTLRLTSLPGGGEGRDEVELAIEDTGPGIAPDLEQRLFMPYVSTKGSRGTGLGLALVHRIVMEHEGSIEVRRAEGGGAAFVLRLPTRGPTLRGESDVAA